MSERPSLESKSQASAVARLNGPVGKSSNTGASRVRADGPLDSFLAYTRSTSNWLLYSDNLAARAKQSKQLTSGAMYFRALSLEMSTRANALAPVSRLPKEILLMIFAIFDDEEPYPSLIRGGRGGNLGWMRYGHVCKAWRVVLLGAPHFWARNVAALPRALPAFLARAGPTIPLHIRSFISSQSRGPNCEALYSRLPLERVQFMRWNLSRMEDSAYLHRNIVTPNRDLPILEGLEIRCSDNPDQTTLSKRPHHRFLLPNLRALNVNRFYVSFAMPNLTELFLYRPPVPMSEIFDDLRYSPSLRYVRFERCRFSPVKSPLPLPCLEFLQLDCCDSTEDGSVYDLFETYLTLPAFIQLDIIVGGGSDEDDPELLYTEHDILAATRLCTRLSASRTVALNILTLDGNAEQMCLSCPKDDMNIEVSKLVARICCLDSPVERMLGMTVAPVLFRQITVLDVLIDPWMPWDVVYAALPNVRVLRLDLYHGPGDGVVLRGAFDSLTRNLANKDSDDLNPTPVLLLPKLNTISMSCESLCETWRDKRGEGEETRQTVVRALQIRADLCAVSAGTPRIQTLRLHKAKDIQSNGGAWLDQLREVVPFVECVDADVWNDTCGWDLQHNIITSGW
ncbi:unnamed protein product [Peniophora sp. CBMAI 1063]|nr:unnamed protein product [Peniophora sp. CBMAI 1063]